MKAVYDFIGGRKLLFGLSLCAISSIFVFTDHCTAMEWINFQKWIFGIYAGGNVGEHVAKTIKKGK